MSNKVILLVDDTLSQPLSGEISTLISDLTNEGWAVLRYDVSRKSSVKEVKSLIKIVYDADPANVKSVILLGHIPVPYSGDQNPDGHPDHKGAWAADTYYGSFGVWTDATVNNTGAEKDWNDNVPGDTKFDQNTIPWTMALAIGRIDFSNMTCFANKPNPRSELDLTRQYLRKNHAFRTGQIVMPMTAAICDAFNDKDYQYSFSARHSFPLMFGASNVVEIEPYTFFDRLTKESFLCAAGYGGGGFYTCNGVGSSDDFAVNDIKAVFLQLLGSYFGDWDNESALMRAALGSGNVLTCCWSGVPYVYLHEMANGLTIGECFRRSANGVYSPQGWNARGVHMALLGDPTLRLSYSAVPIQPQQPIMSTAKFEGLDTTTKGNWIGKYGSDGFLIAGAVSKLPPYAAVTFANKQDYTWTDASQDGRALQTGQSAPRIAAAWHTPKGATSFTVAVNFKDALQHWLSVYFLDWDGERSRRQEKIEVLDTTGAVLDTRILNSFADGVWLSWEVSGPVTLRITALSAANAVLSGIFFNPVIPPVVAPPLAPYLQEVDLMSSQDAGHSWTVVATFPADRIYKFSVRTPAT